MKNNYLRYTIISTIYLSIFLFCSLNAYSQEIIRTLEAENAELTLPSTVKSATGYSGGKYVGDNNEGGSIIFRNVEIEEEGTYEFRTYYISTSIRSIAIQSGTYPKMIGTTPMIKTRTPAAEMITYIYLNKGKNTLIITPYGGNGPDIDKFEIISTSLSMPRPEPITFSREYDLTDDALISSSETSDGLANLGDNDESTVYSFSGSSVEIDMECDLPYLLTGYYLSPGTESSEDVKNWKLEYSTDGSTYSEVSPTSTENVENGVLFNISRSAHSDESKSESAKYYRLTASGGNIGEIQLYGIPYLPNSNSKNFPEDLTQGLKIQSCTAGDPLGLYQPIASYDDRYYNLFDRNMAKKYYSYTSSSFWVEIELASPAMLGYYTLTSCQNYPDRDPKSWVVEGFDDDWEVVSEVAGFEFPTRYTTMKFYAEIKKEYKGYRLRVTQSNGASTVQILKWQLFEAEAPVSSVDTPSENQSSIYSSGNEVVIRSEEKGAYQVFNLSGQLVASGKIDAPEHRFSLEQGIYVVKLLTAEKTNIEKIFVK